MTKHVMLDLETWGTNPFSAIMSIGAVKFDPEVPTSIDQMDKFYVAVDLQSCINIGLQMDVDTLHWWMNDTTEDKSAARRAYFNVLKFELPLALQGFTDWFSPPSEREDGMIVSLPTWGNGADFDNVILGNAFKRVGDKAPWKYSHNRCFRTMKSIKGANMLEPDRKGTHHNALDDAVHQAIWLRQIVRHHRLRV